MAKPSRRSESILSEFDKAWRNAKKDIFRLESLPEYRVEEDLESFAKFKNGVTYLGPEETGWLNQLRDRNRQGVIIRRVRVIDIPLSDYLRYEIDFWYRSGKKGEQVLFLSREEYQRIKRRVGFNPKDFWLFDDKVLLIFRYGRGGEWVDEQKIGGKKIRERYRKLKNLLLKSVVPMTEFLETDKTEQEILKTIEKFSQKLPRFPDGRIDYSHSEVAPVITVFVRCKDRILLLKRGDKVRVYQGKWNAVAGYLDQIRPIREKILEELREEVGVKLKEISSVQLGKPFRFKDRKVGKTWLIHPVLVILRRKSKIKLDWEHTEFKWINPADLKNFDLVPNLIKSFQNASLD